MTHNALRILSAGITVTAVAGMLLAAPEASRIAIASDPSVPPASEVFSANDGKPQGNPEDKTY